jgi:hypothetical protein
MEFSVISLLKMWKQFVSGEYQETTTHKLLVNAGLSEDAANYTEMFLGLGSGAVIAKNVGMTAGNIVKTEATISASETNAFAKELDGTNIILEGMNRSIRIHISRFR